MNWRCWLFHRFVDVEVHYHCITILCSCGREWTELE